MRSVNLVMFISSIYIHVLNKPLQIRRVLSTIVAFYFSHLLNDIFDRNVDSTHMNRSTREFVNQPVHYSVWIKLLTGMVLFWSLERFSLESFVVTIFFILYTPVLKRIPGVKNITVVMFMVYTFFWVSPVSKRDIPAIIFQTIFHFRYEIIKDIVDFENDLKHKIYTIPNTIGVKRTRLVLVLLALINFVVQLFLTNSFVTSSFLLLVDQLFLPHLTCCKIVNKLVYLSFLGQWYRYKHSKLNTALWL